jgi:hypothetical protein
MFNETKVGRPKMAGQDLKNLAAEVRSLNQDIRLMREKLGPVRNDGPNGFVFVAPDDVESPFPDLKAIEATSIPCQTEGVIDDGET